MGGEDGSSVDSGVVFCVDSGGVFCVESGGVFCVESGGVPDEPSCARPTRRASLGLKAP